MFALTTATHEVLAGTTRLSVVVEVNQMRHAWLSLRLHPKARRLVIERGNVQPVTFLQALLSRAV